MAGSGDGVFRLIQNLSPGQGKPLKAERMIILAAYEDVYMGIGLWTGIRLAGELLRA